MALSKIVENSITDGVVSAAKLKDFSAAVDLNGVELILDADQDTSITADTDDVIDFKIAGVEHISLSNSSGDTIIKPRVDAKDIIFQQFDGNKLFCIDDGNFVSVGGNATAPGEIRIYEDTDLGTNYSGFKVGNLTASVAYQLPLADGTSGFQLTTNGSGVLTWASAGTTLANDANNRVVTGTGSGLNGEANLTFDGSTLAVAAAITSTGAITGDSTVQGTTITATTAFVPDASDGAALGTTALEFSDLFLADASTIKFGADQDVTLTHVADAGIMLNTTMQLRFRDSAISIGSPADGDLDINADDEIELNSTLIDINGNVEISGTAVTTGVHTFTAVPVFPNNTVETADIQADAVDGTKIADDAINSEHYTDGSIDTAHIAADQITNAKIADDQIDSEHYVDGSIDTAHIADNQITLAKLAGGTDGNIISYDASGDPVAIATGNDGQVLTSTGAGSPPAFEDAAGGGPFTEVDANKFTYTTATNPVLQVIDSTNTVKAQIQGGNTSAIFGSASAHPVTFIQGSGETTVGTIDTTGAWTFPLQPAFSVTTNATQENLTEDADNTIVFGLEIFDTNGDFASNTFTAPVAGKYMITAKMVVAEIDHDGAYYAAFQIVSSNRDYSVNYSVRNFLQSQPELWTFQVAAVVDMDASDTAFVRYRESGPGASQTDVYNANSSGAREQHQFTGYLLG